MSFRAAMITGGALAAAVLAYSLAVYPALPDRLPVHWGLNGEVDGWGSKGWAAFLGPAVMGLLLLLIPGFAWLSPRHFQVDRFGGTYHYVMALTVGLFGFIHLVALQAGLHPALDSGRLLIGGLFLFLALLGNVLGKVRRNFWIGIRTPWTLASESVWVATHRLAARLLVIAGAAGAVLVAAGAPAGVGLALLVLALLIPAVHSLVLSRRLEAREPPE